MKTYRTQKLIGARLDTAVAKADRSYEDEIPTWYCPSTDWEFGGPIISREHITLLYSPHWEDGAGWVGCLGQLSEHGKTPLIAAMRVFVASKFGDSLKL